MLDLHHSVQRSKGVRSKEQSPDDIIYWLDGRGINKKLECFENRNRIMRYIDRHPVYFKKQMARDLCLSVQTVRKHIKELKQED